MDARELRIGNWLYSNLTKQNFQVNAGDIESILGDPGCCKPIPLTEEWLLKFFYIQQPYGWVLDGFLIRWSIFEGTYKYWIELGNGKRIYFKYVHTLQNFFALTGKELTINK